MLAHRSFGPIDFFKVARSRLGRHILATGIYRVDGLMIDTGPANARGEVRKLLERDGEPEQVVLTHHHEDHVGNAAWVAERAGVTPRIHQAGIELVASRPELPLYRRVTWGTPQPVTAEPVDDVLRTGRFQFRVVHTPGHAPDHVALHEPDQDWLFVGDLLEAASGRLAFDYDDVGEIIASLRKLLAIPDCILFCQHRGPQAGHQHGLGRRLDRLLGLRERAVVLHEEGRSVPEIARELELRSAFYRIVSGGEMSARNLVRKLLEDAGKPVD